MDDWACTQRPRTHLPWIQREATFERSGMPSERETEAGVPSLLWPHRPLRDDPIATTPDFGAEGPAMCGAHALMRGARTGFTHRGWGRNRSAV